MRRTAEVRVRSAPALVALLGALALGACGFHPRGSRVALDDAGRLFLDADRGLSIEESLRTALLERAFTLAANRDEADIVLRVADERRTQRIVSVRSTGRVSEYELGHAVSVAIARDAVDGTPAEDVPAAASGPVGDPAAANGLDGPPVPSRSSAAVVPADPAPAAPAAAEAAVPALADRVQVTREYTYDESQVLGKENEARILRGEMSEELVRQIVLRTVASLARTSADEPG